MGPGDATPVLLEGLRRLEYRGYDSAGLAVVNGDARLSVVKRAGKLGQVEAAIDRDPLEGSCGIAHTRWATHGAPTERNAHPHVSQDGGVALVHNGIIENAGLLRRQLEARGYRFRSDTDTEVVVHLVDFFLREGSPLEEALALALERVEGTYGVAAISAHEPDKLVAARQGSPLLLGVGASGQYLVGSDAAAVVAQTRDVVYLADGDYAKLERTGYRVYHMGRGTVRRSVHQVTWDLSAIERGGFEHFMLKEIFEQPRSLRDVLRGRLLEADGMARLGGIERHRDELLSLDRVVMTACGTSWHAALIGEYMLEDLARLPVEVEYASEFRYKNPVLDERHAGGRHQPVRRNRGHAGRIAGGSPQKEPAPWASSTWWARPSRAKRPSAATCTPDPRWGWRPPRPSPASSWCSLCSPCGWDGTGRSRCSAGAALSRP